MGEITLSIARQITKHRNRLGLSKKELAAIVEVAPSAVSGWENGDYAPGASTLVKLSELFGITIDELYGIDNKKLAAITDNELDSEVYELLKRVPPAKIEMAKSLLRVLTEHEEKKE
jgi:transcriptional regulator with XRE-family HTH domain